MALTKVQIISNALCLVGHEPIITLSPPDADQLTQAAEQAFDFILPSSIAMNSWRFAARISQLSLLSNQTPPVSWKYVYQLPSGYLKNIRIIPQNYNYEIFQDLTLYSNLSGPLYMEHIFLPDISMLPPWFTHYFIYELAAYMALSNAQKTEYYTVLEGKRQQMVAIAMGLDAMNRPNASLARFPVLDITDNIYYDYPAND